MSWVGGHASGMYNGEKSVEKTKIVRSERLLYRKDDCERATLCVFETRRTTAAIVFSWETDGPCRRRRRRSSAHVYTYTRAAVLPTCVGGGALTFFPNNFHTYYFVYGCN